MEAKFKCQYLCKKCEKVFKSNVTLKTHIKKYHKQEALKECNDQQENLRESENGNSVNLSYVSSTRARLSSTSTQ